MTKEYFEAMKADLLTTYAADLCEESLDDIKAASNVTEFIDVLNKYTAFLKYKTIPDIDWAHKWFDEHEEEAEAAGCYMDVSRVVINPDKPITLFGKTHLTLIVTDPRIYRVTTQDKSCLTIDASGVCAINVRQKHDSRVTILQQDKTSIIKIRKV